MVAIHSNPTAKRKDLAGFNFKIYFNITYKENRMDINQMLFNIAAGI
jgi:hypothetical protein